MNITSMLSELRSERQQIDEAILVIERLARGQGKRRGRPPKWMAQVSEIDAPSLPAVRKRRAFSAATRKKMAEAQRKRWAALKKAKAA